MLDSLTLLRAMNGIHEEDVVMAENSYFEKTVKHFKTKRIVTFALAAVLILAMSVTAYAAWKEAHIGTERTQPHDNEHSHV